MTTRFPYRWFAALTLLFAYSIQYLDRVIATVLTPRFAGDIGLTTSDIGTGAFLMISGKAMGFVNCCGYVAAAFATKIFSALVIVKDGTKDYTPGWIFSATVPPVRIVADARHTDKEVHVPHHLGEDERWDFLQRQGVTLADAVENAGVSPVRGSNAFRFRGASL
jgi:hypothetical protein